MRGRSPLIVTLLCSLLALASRSVGQQSHALPPPVGGITVPDVIRLSQAGLSDNTIIAQIRMRPQPFDLSPDDLLQLRIARVPNPVIEAMAEPPAPPPGKTATGKSPSPHSPSPRSLPTEPGMYIATANGSTKIIGQVVTFNRTGSLLVHGLTIGIKAKHENIQLLGAHAQIAVDGQPAFYFIPVKQEADTGVDAGDLVLVRLEEKPERRQFEMDAQGDWRASKGISITHQVELLRSEETEGVYKVTPAGTLVKGEYALYLRRGEGLTAYLYDFSSDGGEQ